MDWLNGKGQQIVIGEILQETAQQCRGDYLEYIGELSLQHASDSWWLSSLSEKNQYISKVFLRSCYVLLAERIVREQEGTESLFFIVQDRAVRKCLRQHLRTHLKIGLRCREPLTGNMVSWMGETVQFLLRRAWFMLKHLSRILVARILVDVGKNLSDAGVRLNGGGLVLLHSWIDSRSFDERGGYQSINFGDLQRHLLSRGRSCAIVPTILPVMPFQVGIRALLRSGEPFLLPQLFLTPPDVLAAVVAGSRRPRASTWPLFRGVDISELILDEQRQDWVAARHPTNALIVETVRRWAKAGIPIQTFIYTFENQVWEKAYCMAFRRHYPETSLIGYQDANLSPMALNFFMAGKEVGLLPFPDALVTNGRYSFELLGRSGYDFPRLCCGGALRYQYLTDTSDKLAETRKRQGERGETGAPVVLVTPSVGKALSCELVWKVLQAFGRDIRVRVVLKCHPYLPFSDLSGCLRGTRLPPHFEVSLRPVRELLLSSRVLLYMDSTTSLEALALGVPLIHVVSDFGLDFDPLGGVQEIRQAARTPEQIREAVLSVSDTNVVWAERAQRGRELASQFFGAINEGVYQCFLEFSAGLDSASTRTACRS